MRERERERECCKVERELFEQGVSRRALQWYS
jgi:hypothetical protein